MLNLLNLLNINSSRNRVDSRRLQKLWKLLVILKVIILKDIIKILIFHINSLIKRRKLVEIIILKDVRMEEYYMTMNS
jgi:hypothetical protein|nr:MAG TPA: hypothetical protein [Caudoviricetes sp.]